MRYTTQSSEETKKIGQQLAKKIKQGVIALSGELGAGKTTFVQGFAEGLGIKDKVISPTFVLIRQHQVPHTQKMLYHLDLYRLEGEIDSVELGLKDMIEGEHIILIEWAEKIKAQLPSNTTWVSISKKEENNREIKFRGEIPQN